MNFLGLDVGEKRVGMALANDIAKMPSPLDIISPDELTNNLLKIISQHDVQKIIIGLPKRIDGTDSEQTTKIRAFASILKEQTNIEIDFADEALTSRDARDLIANTKKYKHRKYYDDLSACYILEEYLRRSII